jgi:hypothetical protein
MMTHKFHKFWLLITTFVVISFGPVFALGTMLATSEPARFTLDILGFPLDGLQDYNAPTTRFLSALTGGFLTGWGMLIWCLRAWLYDTAPEMVRKSVVTSLLAWFFMDSAGSIASGNPSNAFFNILVLLIGVGPLWFPAKTDK